LASAFVLSLPKLANVGGILLLAIFLFAILGNSLFNKVIILPAEFGMQYNDQANFRGFYKSVLMLLRCMTGEAWNTIMGELSRDAFQVQSKESGFLFLKSKEEEGNPRESSRSDR
jgi:hypothetical protein